MKEIFENELNMECSTLNDDVSKVVLANEIFPTCPCGLYDCDFACDFFTPQNYFIPEDAFADDILDADALALKSKMERETAQPKETHPDSPYHNTADFKMITTNNDAFSSNQS